MCTGLTADDVTITKIPLPGIILKGDWGGIVYLIETISSDLAEHEAKVVEKIYALMDEFGENSHSSISLVDVRREVVYNDDRFSSWASLVQFRVRDSY